MLSQTTCISDYLTANSCIHEGYEEYDWPSGWGEQTMSADKCGDISSDGSGTPEQFWNCAEVSIKQDAATVTVDDSSEPSQPTKQPQFEDTRSEEIGSKPPAMLPQIAVGLEAASELQTRPTTQKTGKTIVGKPRWKICCAHVKTRKPNLFCTLQGYYASWQWYEKSMSYKGFAYFISRKSAGMTGTNSPPQKIWILPKSRGCESLRYSLHAVYAPAYSPDVHLSTVLAGTSHL